jgi:hypothetical protein
VPEYAAQPGTVVMGASRPPPQSRKAQISPVPGTYQIRLAPPYATVWEDVHPERSVLARATADTERTVRREVIEGIFSKYATMNWCEVVLY